MKKIYFTFLLAIAGFTFATAQPMVVPDSIATYVKFVDQQKLSAKDYILSLFDRYDIVIFCERDHDELTQYQLLADLFADSRFYNQVGNIFMEMGGSNFDNQINNYLLLPNLTPEQSNQKALEIQRNATWYPVWEHYNYHFLLTSLYDINKALPENKRIKLHRTDIAIRYDEIKTAGDVMSKILNGNVQGGRDSVMGNNIVNAITKMNAAPISRRKYFIILNSAHATRGIYTLPWAHTKSATSYIFDKFGDRAANVLLNFGSMLNLKSTSIMPEAVPILNGKLDAAFEFLGVDDKGFDIKGSPLENQRFENFTMLDTSLTNEKVFTGFVFYKSFPRQEEVNGVPGLVDETFKPELERRYKLWSEITGSYPTTQQFQDYNKIIKKSLEGLVTYWQRVMYWAGGGKSILAFYKDGKPIEETINFIKQERSKGSNSDYNVSELGINAFGGALMQQGKNEDASTILKLNIELYPNSWNTYDSYGDVLLKLGKKGEAAKAYKKSVELNPGNEKAKMILKTME